MLRSLREFEYQYVLESLKTINHYITVFVCISIACIAIIISVRERIHTEATVRASYDLRVRSIGTVPANVYAGRFR